MIAPRPVDAAGRTRELVPVAVCGQCGAQVESGYERECSCGGTMVNTARWQRVTQ